MASRDERLTALIEPAVTAYDCQLWGLEFMQQGRNGLLRVYIERPDEGVSIDDCEKVSRQISSVLDVEDPITSAYTLEVSSPGMERRLFTLEQCKQYLGEQLKVRLRIGFEGRRNFSGVLNGVEGEEIVLRSGDQEYLFPFDTIERATLVPTFE